MAVVATALIWSPKPNRKGWGSSGTGKVTWCIGVKATIRGEEAFVDTPLHGPLATLIVVPAASSWLHFSQFPQPGPLSLFQRTRHSPNTSTWRYNGSSEPLLPVAVFAALSYRICHATNYKACCKGIFSDKSNKAICLWTWGQLWCLADEHAPQVYLCYHLWCYIQWCFGWIKVIYFLPVSVKSQEVSDRSQVILD